MIDSLDAVDPSAEQRAVVEHPVGTAALVDAGAGTGKTFTIVERVARIAEDPDSPARSILLLTFSRKAAAELRGRIVRRLGPHIDPPECATFHAFALGTLKEYGFDLDLSPDFVLINDVDAAVEFYRVFDEFVRGASTDVSGFTLRFGVVDPLCDALFDVWRTLRDRHVPVDAFRERALAAAERFSKVKYRALRSEQRRSTKTIVEIGPADFAKEIAEERARIEAAARLFKAFDERLRERKALTYADLLERAQAAVRSHPSVGDALRRRYRHCIVDEFQDTDPRQIELLRTIFGPTLERVMVVGDPRQSIYGFRGISPMNVDDFRHLPACTEFGLTENRRSRQEILDLAHDVIKLGHDDPAPLRAVRGPARAPVVHVRSRWVADGEPAPNAATTRELEARWVAATISALLESGRRIETPEGRIEPVRPRDIAILSRRKTKLQPLIEALNDLDLPFRQYGGAGFYDAPEVLDALAWFRLVADPLDDNAMARVLSSPSVGVSDATIVELCKGMTYGGHLAARALVPNGLDRLDADGRTRIERLRSTMASLQAYAGAPLVIAWEAMLDRAGLVLTADVRSGTRHDQARANLEKLSAMVRGFAERNPGARAIDFVRYVKELDRVEADDQEADPPSADAVNVMTIHAAKGLEWPIVFLIDVWPQEPHNPPQVWIDDTTGALLVTEGPDGAKPFHTECVSRFADDAGMVPAEKPKDAAREAEERRLFYVGLTRARDEVFVSGFRWPPTKNNPQGRVHPYLQHVIEWVEGDRGWETVDEEAPKAGPLSVTNSFKQTATMPLSEYVRTERARPAVAVPILSFSSIARFERCPRSVNYRLAYNLPSLASFGGDDTGDGAVDLQGRPPRPFAEHDVGAVDLQDRPPRPFAEHDVGAVDLYGRPPRSLQSVLSLGKYGDLVHRALELWARSAGERSSSELVAAAVRDLGIRPSSEERRRAEHAVGAVIAAFAGAKPMLSEAPFTLEIDGVTITGFIDVIVRRGDGSILLIDYKTGSTEKEAYALQLALYRKAAKEAYSLDVATCAIARINDDTVELEEVDLPDEAEIARRIRAVADGIASADITAHPGAHCAACPYRAAPCMDYEKVLPAQAPA